MAMWFAILQLSKLSHSYIFYFFQENCEKEKYLIKKIAKVILHGTYLKMASTLLSYAKSTFEQLTSELKEHQQ